jgi:hypothetical protein
MKERVMRDQRSYLALGLVVAVIGSALLIPSTRGEGGQSAQGSFFTAHNESGTARTINVAGFPVMAVDNPFFLDLGVDGRRCVTCHEPQTNMTVTPARLRARFDATEGNDPIFRPNDGSNSPLADTSTVEARRAAYSMLLTKGLIRIGLPIPATAEFEPRRRWFRRREWSGLEPDARSGRSGEQRSDHAEEGDIRTRFEHRHYRRQCSLAVSGTARPQPGVTEPRGALGLPPTVNETSASNWVTTQRPDLTLGLEPRR